MYSRTTKTAGQRHESTAEVLLLAATVDRMWPNAVSRDRPINEHTINRLKRFRRIATRDEKLTATDLAMVTTACILEWL